MMGSSKNIGLGVDLSEMMGLGMDLSVNMGLGKDLSSVVRGKGKDFRRDFSMMMSFC